MVREVFSSVAARYDLMNDLMSGGIHRIWKDAMVEWLNPQPGWTSLDVAGGTGDIALRIAGLARARGAMPPTSRSAISMQTCCAKASAARRPRTKTQSNGCAAMPRSCRSPIAQFDAYTIAFGIRNVTHIERALAEARRVLKPGGRFLCLEFSQVEAAGTGYAL